MVDASAVVMTSINGRPINENIKAEIETLVNDAKDMLESFRISKLMSLDSDTEVADTQSDKNSKILARILRQIREAAASFATLDELIAMFPWWTRIFHTRYRTAVSTDYALYRFVQIGPYAIGLDFEHPVLKFTPEDAQDYITLRYKEPPYTEADIRLLRRIESLDRMTVLNLWVDGYPVHQALIPYMEDMQRVNLNGVKEACVFQIPMAFLWNRQHQLRWRKNVNGVMVDMPDFSNGLCLPDHSCCNQEGMFDEELRRIVFNSSADQRELIQVENLMQRMKAQYEQERKR